MNQRTFGFRKLLVKSSPSDVGEFLATWWLDDIEQSLKVQTQYSTAVTGGSTPREIYHHVARLASSYPIDWGRVHLLWTDERDVPLDHIDSNYHMAMESGLAQLPIPQDQIHPMQFGKSPSRAEDGMAYHRICAKTLGNRKVFDWIFAGLGEDGHTASLFPHSPGYDTLPKLDTLPNAPEVPFALAHWIEAKNAWRMTLTLSAMHRARIKVGCVTGSAKAAILAAVLQDRANPFDYPASWLGCQGTPITWVADTAAALNLAE